MIHLTSLSEANTILLILNYQFEYLHQQSTSNRAGRPNCLKGHSRRKTFLDINQAFDKLWHTDLFYKITFT